MGLKVEDLTQKINRLNVLEEYGDDSIGIETDYENLNLDGSVWINLWTNAEIIRYEHVSMDKLSDVDWTPYKLSTVLNNYGRPTSVRLEPLEPTEPSDQSHIGYNLILVYDHLGFGISYGSPLINRGQNYHFCPGSDNFDQIEFFSQLPDPPKWPSWLRESQLQGRQDLESVTNMTIQEFCLTYKQEGSKECIEASAKKWWENP